jgi:hypothetical protein
MGERAQRLELSAELLGYRVHGVAELAEFVVEIDAHASGELPRCNFARYGDELIQRPQNAPNLRNDEQDDDERSQRDPSADSFTECGQRLAIDCIDREERENPDGHEARERKRD